MSPDDRSAPDEIERLAARVRGGETRARERLLRALYPKVHRWALVRTGDPADADDVSQEAMLRIHERLDDFRGDARFTSWAYRIVANIAVDYGRRASRRDRGREPLQVVDGHVSGSSELEGLDRRRALEIVQQFVLALPEGQRTVFHLIDIDGNSPADVSDMLEMNPSTVRAHLFKARRSIRRRLLDQHPTLAEDVRP